jgi:CshA-type fibril repeat protein
MLRRLVLSLLVAVLALGTAAAPAVASGSADLFPRVGASDAACDATHPCRAALEWRTNAYGPAGDTQIQRRTLFTVFARAGEQILTGSSSIGTGAADIAIWNPGVITNTEAATLPALVDGTNGFSCAAHRPDATSLVGKLSTRAQELARAQSVDGTQNTAGYVPCVYTAPTTGLYRVAFYGAAGNGNGTDGAPDRNLDPAAGFTAAAGSSINAWDVAVRAGTDNASVADIPGRVLTYVLAGFTGGNPRPVTMKLYLNTLDGYRYAVDTHGFDPNGFVFYGNREGFLDADGTTPLNHDVVGTGANPQQLPTLLGGVHLAKPQYPLSFEPLATETLDALGIPLNPVPPTLSAVDFSGLATDHGSYVGQGGTFELEAGSGGTYEIVISRDGVNFDAGLPGNRALRGVVGAGTFTVTWDGEDNAGVALPVKNGYAVKAVLRAGEYHAPMLDVESSTQGGPSITLLNPPANTCPFTGVTSNGTNCTRVFFDDRTYLSSTGVRVGDLTSGTLCAAFSGVLPAQLFADPTTGIDSTSNARRFGDGGGLNANQFCPATGGTLGDAKGLDVWTYFPSKQTATSLDVLPIPAVPVALPDTGTTPVNTPLVVPAVGVLGNDAGTRLSALHATLPAHGSVALSPDGSYTYTPVSGYIGTDQFQYTATDDYGQTSTTTVTITVTPVAGDDAWTTTVNTPLTVAAPGVLGNDAGDGLAAGSPSTPAHGKVTLTPDGALLYTPDHDFSGTDTFTYVASDGTMSDGALVTITVTPKAADDDLGTVSPNVTSTGPAPGVLVNDSGTDLTVVSVGTPAHGTVTIAPGGGYAYTPPAGWGGTDTFTYTARDTAGQTADATVTIRVTTPVQLAHAADDKATGVPGQPTTLTELTNDSPGDNLAWVVPSVRLVDPVSALPVTTVTVPGQGTWTIDAGHVVFTPVADFQGDAHLDYQVTNTRGQTVTATMTVTYPPPPISTLAAPVLTVAVTVPVATPAAPSTTVRRQTTVAVTVTMPGRRTAAAASLATTGSDPVIGLLIAFSLVGTGLALSVGRRRLAARR